MRQLDEQEKQRVQVIVADKLGFDEEEITSEKSFRIDLGADSLDMIEICMEIEKEFNITIPDIDFEGVKMVSELYECIEKFL